MGFLYSQLFVTPQVPTQTLAGQTVIITGSNVGLGKEAARHIARLDVSKLILAVRNVEAGEAAKKELMDTTGCSESTIEVWKLDLGDYDSVKSFAERARALPRIDVLLENAGIATSVYKSVGGHESTITVNVVSTFLLALLLAPKLKETAKKYQVRPRLVIVSSEVHAWTTFKERGSDHIFETIDDRATADMGDRYQLSKLLEILVVREIAPLLQASEVVLNCLNPGLCYSELAREVVGLKGWFFAAMKALLARTTEVGSRTLVAAAVADETSHGKYMHDGVVNDDMLSDFVRSADGTLAGQKVWAELKAILETIESKVTDGLQNDS